MNVAINRLPIVSPSLVTLFLDTKPVASHRTSAEKTFLQGPCRPAACRWGWWTHVTVIYRIASGPPSR